MARRIKQRVFKGSLAHNFSSTGATQAYNAAGQIGTQSFTASMWVKASPETIAVSGTHNLWRAPGLLVSQFGAQILVYIDGVLRHADPTFFSARANRWVHIVVVCNNTANTISTYADGELSLTTSAIPAWNLTVVQAWEIGASTFNGMIAVSSESTVQHWNGIAMTASQVASLYYDDIDPDSTKKIIEVLFSEQAGVTAVNTGTLGGSFTITSTAWSSDVPGCVVRRARRNYLPYSNAPTNANWTINSGLASVTADGGVPHPTRASGVVYRATENTANSGHVARVYPGNSAAFGNSLAGLDVRFSTKVKKGVGRDFVYFALNISALGVYFELATGVFRNPTAGIRYGAKSLGSGWYEVWVAGTSTVAGNGVPALWMSNVPGNISYLGDSSYFYLCDPTLQPIEYAPDYVETTTAGAAYFGEEGSPQEENLFKYSEDTSSAAWTKSGFTTTTGQTDPLGGTTAVALFETAANVQHAITLPQVMTGNRWYCMSAYVKRGPTSRTTFLLAPTNILGLYFDASTLTTQLYNTSALEAYGGYEDVGNGWYRIWVAGYMNTAGAGYASCRVDTCVGGVGTTSVYLGDAAYSALVWGLQMTEGRNLTSYVKTVESAINSGAPRGQAPSQNLIRFSNDMTQVAAFALTNLTSIVALGNVGPGGLPAFRMADNVGAGGHYTSQTISPVPTIGRAYTLSANVRAGTKTAIVLAPEGAGFQVTYDLTAVTATTGVGAPLGTSITPLGDGWYRCSVTFVSAGASGYRFYISPTAYVADGTGTMDWCGLQLTEASGVANYVATGTATTNEGAPRGLVGQQNLIIRTGALDNAVTWIPSLTTIAAGAADPQGGSTAFTLRETNGGTTIYSFLQTPPAALVRNVAFTFSIYVKRGTGTRNICLGANSGQIAAFYDLTTGAIPSGGLYDPQGNVIGRAMEAVGDGWYRCSVTYYQNSSTSVIVYVAQGTTTTITGDTANTLILWHPQMTQSTGLSPYVETTTTAINAGAPRGQSL